jgi:hypothetical protein
MPKLAGLIVDATRFQRLGWWLNEEFVRLFKYFSLVVYRHNMFFAVTIKECLAMAREQQAVLVTDDNRQNFLPCLSTQSSSNSPTKRLH